jgi:hypothetical protein
MGTYKTKADWVHPEAIYGELRMCSLELDLK